MTHGWLVTPLHGGAPIGIIEANSAKEAARCIGLRLCRIKGCVDDPPHAHIKRKGLEVSQEHPNLLSVPFPAFGTNVIESISRYSLGVDFCKYPLVKAAPSPPRK